MQRTLGLTVEGRQVMIKNWYRSRRCMKHDDDEDLKWWWKSWWWWSGGCHLPHSSTPPSQLQSKYTSSLQTIRPQVFLNFWMNQTDADFWKRADFFNQADAACNHIHSPRWSSLTEQTQKSGRQGHGWSMIIGQRPLVNYFWSSFIK